MAETKTETKTSRSDSEQGLTRQEGRGLRRYDPFFSSSPFEFMDRMSEEMDRWFDRMWRDFGFPQRSWLARTPFFGRRSGATGMWMPRIETLQKGDQLIVRAELPGLKKDDVEVELTDDALTIRGERREEREEEREGYRHSEREYGQFYRSIPLPEGVITESAQATFRDGVLEITMNAPPSEATRGRRIEIKEAAERK